MPRALLLEDFLAPVAARDPGTAPVADPAATDAAFEAGYRAGWDDASKAQDTGDTNAERELIQSLQEAAFSFHEARSAVLQALKPVFDALTGAVFPALLAEALGARITEAAYEIASEAADLPFEIRASETDFAILQERLPNGLPFEARLCADGSLGPGRAHLKIGSREAEIDMTELLENIRAGIDAFYAQEQEARAHG